MNNILRRLFPFIFVIALSLASCITMQKIPESVRTHMISHVPFYPQEINQCGPASLAGVMNYWGMSVTPEEIAQEIFSGSAGGTLSVDMLIYAQKRGLHAEQFRGTMHDIRNNIDLGFPLIVLVDYGFSFYQRNHFMVVVGYNEKGIIVNSGNQREKMIPEEEFLKTWRKTNFWTLLLKKE